MQNWVGAMKHVEGQNWNKYTGWNLFHTYLERNVVVLPPPKLNCFLWQLWFHVTATIQHLPNSDPRRACKRCQPGLVKHPDHYLWSRIVTQS